MTIGEQWADEVWGRVPNPRPPLVDRIGKLIWQHLDKVMDAGSSTGGCNESYAIAVLVLEALIPDVPLGDPRWQTEERLVMYSIYDSAVDAASRGM